MRSKYLYLLPSNEFIKVIIFHVEAIMKEARLELKTHGYSDRL